MRRIYWDSMLLIYLLEGNPGYANRIESMLRQSFERQDQLLLTCVGLGEVLTGKRGVPPPANLRRLIDEMGFSYLPFEESAVDTFASLRRQDIHRADALHLACAAAAGVDLFLTNDKKLLKLHVPGINFIVHFDNELVS